MQKRALPLSNWIHKGALWGGRRSTNLINKFCPSSSGAQCWLMMPLVCIPLFCYSLVYSPSLPNSTAKNTWRKAFAWDGLQRYPCQIPSWILSSDWKSLDLPMTGNCSLGFWTRIVPGIPEIGPGIFYMQFRELSVKLWYSLERLFQDIFK